jgi:DNA topoisomerase IA
MDPASTQDGITGVAFGNDGDTIGSHGQRNRPVIGVGRVKTPTLAIVCKREQGTRNFVPLAYFEVIATAKVADGQLQMRCLGVSQRFTL